MNCIWLTPALCEESCCRNEAGNELSLAGSHIEDFGLYQEGSGEPLSVKCQYSLTQLDPSVTVPPVHSTENELNGERLEAGNTVQ